MSREENILQSARWTNNVLRWERRHNLLSWCIGLLFVLLMAYFSYRRLKVAAGELPLPRPFDWEMKPLSSAKTGLRKLPDGRLELTIEHDTVRGVTPRMLLWWFSHIGGTMEYAGQTYPRYLVWHPLDHIDWELVREAPGGGARVGARFRIVEAFGRNPDHLVDSVDTVEKLDETGIVLCGYVLEDRIFRLEHRFTPVQNGTRYDSQMIVGSSSLFGRLLFNRFVRPRLFSDEMGPAWLKHNVEEVGTFEHFLPALYARHRPSGDPAAGYGSEKEASGVGGPEGATEAGTRQKAQQQTNGKGDSWSTGEQRREEEGSEC